MSATATMQQTAAEALNSALFNLGFTPLGNSEDGRVDWWHRGTFPKDIRVSVARSSATEHVSLKAEWHNLVTASRGSQEWTLDCSRALYRAEVVEGTVGMTIELLELFKEVLEGSGRAGAQNASESESEDEWASSDAE